MTDDVIKHPGCCHTCGAQLPPQVSTEDTVQALKQYCRENNIHILPGDRVKEDAAAILLDRSPATLRNWRSQAAPLPIFRTGAGRGRITYRLSDIAEHLNRLDDEFFPLVTER
jgi:hypothetical protein